MTFHEVFYFLSDGHPIRRESWNDIRHISFDREHNCFLDVLDDTGGWWCKNPPITMDDLSADDWEVCEWEQAYERD